LHLFGYQPTGDAVMRQQGRFGHYLAQRQR
jgi:hypothetical protein